MTEQVLEEQVTDPDKSALESETDPRGTEKSPDATDAQQKSVETETDEQKNERIQKEAAEKAEKRSRGVQKRIDELTADKHAERKRADELAQQNARILALLEGKSGVAQPAQGEPKREQFESYEDFLTARAEFRAEAKAAAVVEKASKASQEQRAKEAAEAADRALTQGYLERQKQTAKEIPDFNEVMEDADIAVPTQVFNMIKRMPDGPAIAYNMAKNPELAQQFWSNSPEMHGILLGQLSATLKSQQKAATKAPDPGKPVGSKAGTATEPPTDPNQYRAWADKHLK